MRSYVPVHMEFVHQKSFPPIWTRTSLAVHGGQFHLALAIRENPVSSLLGRRNHRASWLDDCGDLDSAGFAAGLAGSADLHAPIRHPQIAVFTDRELLDQGEERDVLDNALAHWGEGETPVFRMSTGSKLWARSLGRVRLSILM